MEVIFQEFLENGYNCPLRKICRLSNLDGVYNPKFNNDWIYG